MKLNYMFIGFIVLALIQLVVPFKMMHDSENVITSGTPYKFKTRPIDPTDPFRGKYITLQYKMRYFITSDTTFTSLTTFAPGDDIRVYIKNDQAGFAVVDTISKKPLDMNTDFVMAKVTDSYKGKVMFELPFTRFYMEETKAYDAELAYRKANRRRLRKKVYSLVYVKDGKSVLDNVFIDDIPIKKYVEQTKDSLLTN
ncbi:GDYXXLXY domain-containing protein [Aquimarina algicola]|uniref:GDYXXLXY domain-containing protein n=1 Tax=Aquimarina algicola TaxID=2589995 RepID=A0A504JG38_9FLAO|nr:GDYXXLXY domain-containing protein [Aquimarina algicola]TPN86708.1 GDYXXLXY domain-containing protein [Aquimarina algicola]